MTEQNTNVDSGLRSSASFLAGLKALPNAITRHTLSTAIVAAVFGCPGPALILVKAAQAGNLTMGQTVAWITANFVLGGLISIIMALRYQQPITGAWSLPGAALVTAALSTSLGFNEAIGGFIMSGIIVFLIGISGIVRRVVYTLPRPVIMAMIAGALIHFGIGAVMSVNEAPWIVGIALVGYVLANRFFSWLPPVILALFLGLGASFFMGYLNTESIELRFVVPELTTPIFTLNGFFAIGLPLSVLVIGAENAQAMGVLIGEKYNPPVNFMTTISGIGGVLAGLFGGHDANIAGPMTAICASSESGDREKRFGATVVNGILFGTFGVTAGIAVPFVLALPSPLITMVAGLAMISVLLAAFQQAFSENYQSQTGAFVTLVIAMSDFHLLGISSPFWALVFGWITTLILKETKTPSDV